jgi:hypothetical protein
MPAFEQMVRPLKNTAALVIIAAAMVWMSLSIYRTVKRANEGREEVPRGHSGGLVRSSEAAARKESPSPRAAEPAAEVVPNPTVKQDEGVPPMPKPHNFRDDFRNRVCAGGLDQANEIHISPSEDSYTLKVTPGCYSPLVYVPKEWESWTFQTDGEWVAYTLGIGEWGPLKSADFEFGKMRSFMADPSYRQNPVRIQGDGSATIYKIKK